MKSKGGTIAYALLGHSAVLMRTKKILYNIYKSITTKNLYIHKKYINIILRQIFLSVL